MPRKRLQNGSVQQIGKVWKLRWYEDVRAADGSIETTRRVLILGPSLGTGKLTKKEARRKADEFMADVNSRTMVPASMMTLHQFVTQHFEFEVMYSMKHSGKLHYQYCLRKILPELGKLRLRDLDVVTLQKFLHSKLTRKAGDGKLSPQTVSHLRNAISAVIQHAKRLQLFTGENPARMVILPEIQPKKRPALTWEQAQMVLMYLEEPYRTMALLSMATSLRSAELCGLRWSRVNLTATAVQDSDGDIIPPHSFIVKESYYKGVWGTLKTKASTRIQPIPEALLQSLRDLRTLSAPSEKLLDDNSEAPVFMSRAGTPIDAHNANVRILKPAGQKAGIPNLSWHSFRRTTATLTGLLHMPTADRVALMGHSSADMTTYYSDSDIERRRDYVNQIGDRITQQIVAPTKGIV